MRNSDLGICSSCQNTYYWEGDKSKKNEQINTKLEGWDTGGFIYHWKAKIVWLCLCILEKSNDYAYNPWFLLTGKQQFVGYPTEHY